jgi:NAD(P)-dependent dehydrogenase (short-subunit alcohol dehydrogenase family)
MSLAFLSSLSNHYKNFVSLGSLILLIKFQLDHFSILLSRNLFFLPHHFAMSSSKYLTKLKGSRVLVFGATSGLGFAVSQAAFEYGATVIITGSKQSKLTQTTTRLLVNYKAPEDSISDFLSSHVCDLSNQDTMEEHLTTLLEAATIGGVTKLDHIVFTAGDALPLKPISEITPAYIANAGTVRFIAPLMLAKLIPKYMTTSADSSFTITSGVIGTKPAPGWVITAGYSMAQEGLARGLAVDLAPVRVNCVSPGSVKTELLSGMPDEALEYMRQLTLTKRLGRPEDLAEAYLYAMKDGFVTGSILHTNGGRLLV